MSGFREIIGSTRWADQCLFLKEFLITSIYIVSATAKKSSIALDKNQQQQADQLGGAA